MQKNKLLTQEISGPNSRANTRSEEMGVNKTRPPWNEKTARQIFDSFLEARECHTQCQKIFFKTKTIKLNGVQKFTEADSMTSSNHTMAGNFLRKLLESPISQQHPVDI